MSRLQLQNESFVSPELPATIHATAVVIGETGILIRGASGAGKSTLARRLMEIAGNAGQFGRLIGDDRIRLSVSSGRLIARPHPEIAGLIETRGQGIQTIPCEFSARLHCVIDLISDPDASAGIPRFPEKDVILYRFGGIELARLALPAGLSGCDKAAEMMSFFRGISEGVRK
jgi:HPr kinase/phosphorylase